MLRSSAFASSCGIFLSALVLVTAPLDGQEPSIAKLRADGHRLIEGMTGDRDADVRMEGLLLLLESFQHEVRVESFDGDNSPDFVRQFGVPDLVAIYRSIMRSPPAGYGTVAERLAGHRRRFAANTAGKAEQLRQLRKQYAALSPEQRASSDGGVLATIAFDWSEDAAWREALEVLLQAMAAPQPDAVFNAAFQEDRSLAERRNLQAAYLAYASKHPKFAPQWDRLDLRVTTANLLELCFATAIARREQADEADVLSQALRARLRDLKSTGGANAVFRKLDAANARELLPDVVDSVRAPALSTLAQIATLSPLAIEQLLLNRSVNIDCKSQSTYSVIDELRNETHLYLWMDEALPTEDAISFRYKGPWMQGMQQFARENQLAFSRLGADVYWVGPSDRLPTARILFQSSEQKLPSGVERKELNDALRRPGTLGSAWDLPLREAVQLFNDGLQTPMVLDDKVDGMQLVSFDPQLIPLHIRLTLLCDSLGLNWDIAPNQTIRVRKQARTP